MAKVVFAILFVLMSSCDYSGKYTEPYAIYRANQFNTEDIPQIEEFIREIAKQWNFKIVEKGRNQMKTLTQGREAFHIFLLDKQNQKQWIIAIGNSGLGDILTWSIYDRGKIPIPDLQRLTLQVKETLEQHFDLKFCEVNLATSMCNPEESTLTYRTDKFNVKHIPEIEWVIGRIAERWNLRIVTTDQKQIEAVTGDTDGFSVFLISQEGNNKWVLNIENIGADNVVTWDVYDDDVLSHQDMQLLIQEVKDTLKQRFDLEFCEVDSTTSLCKSNQD